MQVSITSVECECGKTALKLRGPHLYCTSCHCDDCQQAAACLADEHGVKNILDPYGGTEYVLHRKDSYSIVRGTGHLRPHRLREGSPTRRMIAICCGSPMYLAFDNAQHWITVYRKRFGTSAPDVQSRIMTKFLPPGTDIPESPPSYKSFPVLMIWHLVTSRVQMALGR
jgi:hypothetical protein